MNAGSYKPTNFPWILNSENPDDPDSPGGIVVVATAEAALNIGDAVYISAAHSANKSTTASLYQGRAGFVVGGKNTQMLVMQDDGMVGKAAAAAGEQVLICVAGKCKAVADGAITLGTPVTNDNTTAGRVETATITTASADGDNGRILGIALETTTTAGDKFLVLVTPS